jgi:hypothetical protein
VETTPKTPTEALVEECLDLSSSCLYTSTNFYIWLKVLRGLRTAFVIVPLVLGSLATWTVLTTLQSPGLKLLVAALAFFAGLLPTVYRALKFDDNVGLCAEQASEFKNLQDRFRQCAKISSLKSFSEFEAEFHPLMKRLEKARRPSYTPPEWCFKLAQRKVKSGDYDPDVRK